MHHPVLRYEVSIDTEDVAPMQYHRSPYSVYDSVVMSSQIICLEVNTSIRDRLVTGGYIIVLALIYYQVKFPSIEILPDVFVWLITLLTRSLNFHFFPISRCHECMEQFVTLVVQYFTSN